MKVGPEEQYPGGHCMPHGSDSELREQRRLQGLCEWHARTCTGPTKKCPYCGYSYCEYHFHMHFRQY